MGISVALLWIIIPVLTYHSQRTIWQGYEDAGRELHGQGYSNMEILNILQLFEQNAAPLNVGAGSMLFSKGRQTTKRPD